VLGRYLLLERLGAGGFGEVWRAEDQALDREVAVKRIWLGPDCDSERASREAHASARLAHPAIVRLYEAFPVGDAFYLVSELIEGETLAQLIAADALEDQEILEIALALADALAHAHSRGVIHRDVKPQNVLVPDSAAAAADAPESAAKLADFGGASLAGEDALTRTGDVLGTLAYMAPEQTEGRVADEQADLYSLALVTYEALAGVNPVRGANPAATARRIGQRVEPLQRHRRDLPRPLTRALDRALAGAPRERGTLGELRLELNGALEELTGSYPDGPCERFAAPLLPRRPASRAAIARPAAAPLDTLTQPAPDGEELSAGRSLALPLTLWLACALLLIAWQASARHAGVALLLLAALLPLLLLPRTQPGRAGAARIGVGWLACALAPLLGLLGLAGAFPAVAGQAPRWRDRLAYGALGYWWLTLAGALLDTSSHVLWLAEPARMPARAVWEGSIDATAAHVLAPALSLGVLCGALLWALAALVLPWIVRGSNAALDIAAATVWSAALVALAPELDAGLSPALSHPSSHGAVLGAVLGGMLAVAARALRGPI
jgi:eukaryotic-like serine/threonine-protein kinase